MLPIETGARETFEEPLPYESKSEKVEVHTARWKKVYVVWWRKRGEAMEREREEGDYQRKR